MSIDGSKRLIMAGFATKHFKKDYPNWSSFSEEKKKEILDSIESKGGEEKLAKYADHDELVMGKDQIMLVDYPKPINKYRIVYESPHSSIEPYYYFVYHNLHYSFGFPIIDKITDIFTASEHSSFYGAAAQRLGLAQDKVSQYMAAIGQFIRKDLFQLIRDLRWLDERLDFHEKAREYTKQGKLKDDSAEITLKGIWTDMVDGVVQGQRVSANVFQMAQQLQFTSLPDFFFSMHPQKREEINKMVDALDTTLNLKSVLKRKLSDFLNWKDANYKELKVRKNFELKYLRQHYNIINMYLQWIKPYMKHMANLRGDIEKTDAAELISAFEGSMVEIEILGQRLEEGNKKVYTCILETLDYRTRPSLSYQQEAGFHRGPIHMGEMKLTYRAYAWTRKQIEAFKKMKQKEDMEMFEQISSGVKATMDAIREDLDKYLKQAEGAQEKETRPKQKPEALLSPFASVGKGFADFVGMFVPVPGSPTAKAEKEKIKKEASKAAKAVQTTLWLNYKAFKKAHRMLTW
ncbi:hypothetical protein JW851_01870 [Candidatus Woesearchaeota archaeon]|nr:hypothetical protein [Candidatus Woesearchaeota archaeon]